MRRVVCATRAVLAVHPRPVIEPVHCPKIMPTVPAALSTKGVVGARVVTPWINQKPSARTVVHIDSSSGAYVTDKNGKKYFDMGNLCTNVVGHGNIEVANAMREQALRFGHVSPAAITDPVNELAEILGKYMPKNMRNFAFITDGSRANDAAINIARRYTGRHKILSAYDSYHGSTMGTRALTGEARRFGSEYVSGFVKFNTPYPYRSKYGSDLPDEKYTELYLRDLRDLITREGPDQIAAIFLETIIGTNGVIIYPDGYLKGVRKICDEFGILMVCDEVMVGIGRTGKMFAFEHFGIVPDIVTMAKGITSGYVPMSAVAFSDQIYEYHLENPYNNGATYANHPVAAKVAATVLQIMERDHIVENAAALGDCIGKGLHYMKEKYSFVGDVRSLGAFGCMELVTDRETKNPIDDAKMLSVYNQQIQNGIIPMNCRSIVHTNAPLISTKADIAYLFDQIDKTFETLAGKLESRQSDK